MEAEASLGGVGFSSLLVVPAWHLRVYGDLPAYPLLLGLLRGAGENVGVNVKNRLLKRERISNFAE